MEAETRAPRVVAYADEALEKIGILKNPYFEALEKQTMTLEAFRQTQEQFFYAVTFYSRPMAGLIARIPEPKARIEILRNLVEEHGEFKENEFHHTTFQTFLKTLGSDVERLNTLGLRPELRAFNAVLTTACILDEIEVGIGCMGIIEYAFAGISERIGKAVVKNNWVPKDKLVHYSLHAALDKRHAEDFFVLIEKKWDDENRRYYIKQGLDLGAYAFNRMYADLYQSTR